MSRGRMRIALPLMCGTLFFVLGCLYAGAVGTSISEDGCSRQEEFALLDAGGTVHWTLSAWPPGAVDCEFVQPTGEILHATFIPVKDWVIFAIWAAEVGLAVYAGLQRTLWSLALAVGGFLCALALSVFALERPGWAAAIGAAIALAGFWMRRTSTRRKLTSTEPAA